MTVTVELTAEQEALLRKHARAARMTPADYVRSLIVEQPVPRARKRMSGAEALVFWRTCGLLGLFSGGPDSPELARRLRRSAETRQW